MITVDGEWVVCDHLSEDKKNDCEAKIKNHAWGRIKAEGWFFSRDPDRAYCPNHIPSWVAEWRARKKEKK